MAPNKKCLFGKLIRKLITLTKFKKNSNLNLWHFCDIWANLVHMLKPEIIFLNSYYSLQLFFYFLFVAMTVQDYITQPGLLLEQV